jgi:hypothetical protein
MCSMVCTEVRNQIKFVSLPHLTGSRNDFICKDFDTKYSSCILRFIMQYSISARISCLMGFEMLLVENREIVPLWKGVWLIREDKFMWSLFSTLSSSIINSFSSCCTSLIVILTFSFNLKSNFSSQFPQNTKSSSAVKKVFYDSNVPSVYTICHFTFTFVLKIYTIN